MQKQSFKYDGYMCIIKEVKNSGNSGRVFVPKDWAGKNVAIILLDQIVSSDE